MRRMLLVLTSPKWMESFLQINHLHKFANPLFNTFSVSIMSLCWYKILVSSVYRYFWLFDRACGMPLIYNKNHRYAKKVGHLLMNFEKTWKIRILKKWKKNCWRYHQFTHVYEMPQSYEVQFLRSGVR